MALLLLVAGYQHYEKLGDLDAEGLRVHFEMNAIGPILVAQSLRPNLEAGSKVGCQEAKKFPRENIPLCCCEAFCWQGAYALTVCPGGLPREQDGFHWRWPNRWRPGKCLCSVNTIHMACCVREGSFLERPTHTWQCQAGMLGICGVLSLIVVAV